MASLQRLDGLQFVQLLRSGHARLKQCKDTVNALNIFPVPDGDTGTNMELSLASGVSRLASQDDWRLHAAAQALAAGLLMGARGNSGVILSQLFRGFLKPTQQASTLDVNGFANALQEGVVIAYRAVSKPVEGTILTVAREAAAAGVRAARHETDLANWMDTVCNAARQALAKTPDQLPVLKEAGVVDSGGQGLVYIYEGFHAWLRGELEWNEPVATAASPQLSLDFAAAHIDHEGEYGYCTEVLVRVGDADVDVAAATLRDHLLTYGDSLLVVGADNLVKVHVHTLHPGRVLEDALSYGALVKIKIDNMTEQHTDIRQSTDSVRTTVHTPLNSTHEAVPSSGVAEAQVDADARPVSLVTVAAGDGLKMIFESLGAHVVISGGQTMNPSTEEIIDAVQSTGSPEVIVMPNNGNIVMAANQARQVLGDHIRIVPTCSIPEGIAALMAFRPGSSVDANVERMNAAIQSVNSGQVVRAVRDSVYQDRNIKENQYLGLIDQTLTEVGDDRLAVAMDVISAMGAADAELLAIFYGSNVPEQEVLQLSAQVETQFGVEVESRRGGQPVYDYIFALE